ncbi:MAG: DUF362 domain-containing protein [Candidatus Woesearchaeota archaeon]|jgi:hypothetical protein
MANVYFFEKENKELRDILKKELATAFKDCKKIAIKIHFGELNNKTALTPKDIYPITTVLKELNIDYFLYDSSTAYPGPRSSPFTHKMLAILKGFRKVETGDEFIEIEKEHNKWQVCKKLTDADGVLILSHFKGHPCCGFGGAIKNIGMGALTKKSKQFIHDGAKPTFHGKCSKCGACLKACPIDGIKLTDKPEFKECWGCSNCTYICPNNCLKQKVASFDILLSEGACAAYENFKNSYSINIVKRITKMCDCMPTHSEIISHDIGIVMSSDIVAVDKASHDLILKKNKEDVFLKHNKKSGLLALEYAEKLEMGKLKYKLVM